MKIKVGTKKVRAPAVRVKLTLSIEEFDQLFNCVDYATDNLADLRCNGDAIEVKGNEDLAMDLYSQLSEKFQSLRAGEA